jgi:hypothetical protein
MLYRRGTRTFSTAQPALGVIGAYGEEVCKYEFRLPTSGSNWTWLINLVEAVREE